MMDGARACASCGSPLPPGAKFCSSCGHQVTVASSNEERRIVTVLFADLVGFTTLAEHLDPEQVKRLVDGAFERLVDDIVFFGGRVDKLLGDGVLALFGAPVAHEDDAERAVRAALQMQETLAGYVAASHVDAPLRMRIGINTGEVLVGTLAGTDYTAMGDVVNTASRIQSEAPAGGVLVGPTTHALTIDAIGYGEMVELQPRGREQPVETWPALAPLAPPGSRRRRHDLPLVGRGAELALVDAALQRALADERGLLLNVVGESGVGKTRLIDEVVGSLGAHVMLLEGAVAPFGESNVWSPIASAIASRLDLDATLSLEEIRPRALAKAAELFDLRADSADVGGLVEVFLHVLGHPSALDQLDVVARRNAVQLGVAQVLERRSEKGPVVFWLDDLHWADRVVVDLIGHLVDALCRLPFVMITTMRPREDVVWPPSTTRTSVVSITLQPLAREESDELAIELLHDALDGGAADQRVLGALFDRSGGNPLFLQQLAALVADEGAASELPDSLRALIVARLDQLPPHERQVLDNAAILGVCGKIASLQRFAASMGQDFDLAVVNVLDAKGFLELDGRTWSFRSDSVREAAYQMITKASRAQRHAGVHKNMASHWPGAFDDLAHHAASAAELAAELGPIDGVPADIAEQAIERLVVAAEKARDTGSPRMVVRHTTRALGLLPAGERATDRRLQLQMLRAAASIDVRAYAEAHADLDDVLAGAALRRDVVMEANARAQLGSMYHLEGDRPRAREELGHAVELLRAAKATAPLAAALRQRGFIELFGGSLTDAEWFFGEAEGAYRELADERGLAYVEQYRAWASFLAGELDLADQRLHHAAETLNRLGDRNGVGWAFGLLAFVRFFQRRFVEAEDLAAVVRAEANDRGDDWAAAMMQTLIADLRLWTGHVDEALTNAEQARNRFRRLGDRFGLVQSLSALVRAQVALGRRANVQRTSEELLALAEASPLGPMPLLAVAGAAMHRGDGAIALANIERALADMENRGTIAVETSVVLAVANAQVGRLDEALSIIEGLDEKAFEHPFPSAAAALVRAMAADPRGALVHVAAVERAGTGGSSYLDRTLAAVAAAGAHASLGEPADAEAALDAAATELQRVGDVVAVALVQLAWRNLLGHPHPSGEPDESQLGPGWVQVVRQLTSAVGACAGTA